MVDFSKLETLTKSELFYVLKDFKIFSNNTQINMALTSFRNILKDKDLLFPLYIRWDRDFLSTKFTERQKGVDLYFFNISFDKIMSKIKTYSYNEIYKILNNLYMADNITFEDLRQRIIFLSQNRILENIFKTQAQIQITNYKKHHHLIAKLKQECEDLESLIKTNPYKSVEDRLNNLLESLKRSVVTNEEEKKYSLQNLKNINQLKRVTLKELENDYFNAMAIDLDDTDRLDELRLELFGDLIKRIENEKQ